MKKLLLAVLLATGANVFAQDIHLSQFNNAPTFINPACVGDIKYDHRVSLHYRDQWRLATSPYNTMAFSYDYKFALKDDKKDLIGIGAQVFKDKAGETGYNSLQVLGGFGYHKKLGRKQMFSFGIHAAMRQHSINNLDGKWGSQYNGAKFDPSISSGETFYNQSVFLADGNAGAQYTLMPSKYFRARLGASIHHLTRPSVNYIGAGKREDYRFNYNFSMEISSPNHNLSFHPNAMYMKQGEAQEIIGGGLFKIGLRGGRNFGTKSGNGISLGGFYRYKDALVFATQFDMGPYTFGFSYDANVSRLTSGTRGVGGFELSLRYINTPM